MCGLNFYMVVKHGPPSVHDLQRADKAMICWICRVRLGDEKSSIDLAKLEQEEITAA